MTSPSERDVPLVPFRKIDRWGYAVSEQGQRPRIVVPCKFDHAYPFHGIDVAHVTADGKSGLMGKDGKLVLPVEYDWIGDEDEGAFKGPGGLLILRQGDRYGAATDRGEILVPVGQPDQESVTAAAAALLWGRGTPPPGLSRPVDDGVAARYDAAEPYENGFALVKRGDLWGFINEAGDELVAPMFEEAYDFDATGAAPVKKDGRFGHIDSKGQPLAPLDFDDAYSFVNGTAIVAKDGRYGLIRRNGEMAVPCTFEELGDLHGGRAVAGRDGRFGYVDGEGREVVPIEYQSAEPFQGGLGRVSKDGRWGLIGEDGQVVVPLDCEPPDWESGTFPAAAEDRHGVRRNALWGFVDGKGKEAVPCRYRWAWGFEGGLARVAIQDPGSVGFSMPGGGSASVHLFGWIAPDGSEAIPLRYTMARDFEDGVARVQSAKTTQTGYVDRAGTEYWED